MFSVKYLLGLLKIKHAIICNINEACWLGEAPMCGHLFVRITLQGRGVPLCESVCCLINTQSGVQELRS